MAPNCKVSLISGQYFSTFFCKGKQLISFKQGDSSHFEIGASAVRLANLERLSGFLGIFLILHSSEMVSNSLKLRITYMSLSIFLRLLFHSDSNDILSWLNVE
jgi:hypothetical protein